MTNSLEVAPLNLRAPKFSLTERARIEAAIRRTPPAFRQELLQRADLRAKAKGDIWKGGCEPASFDEFCRELSGVELWPRQYDVFLKPGLIRAAHIIDPERKVQELVILFGKGCIAAESRLTDAATGETKTAEEWEKDGRPLLLPTQDAQGRVVPALTSPVYKKGEAPLYRVTLADGRSIRVTAHHRFLTPSGWAYTAQLIPGESRVRAESPRANLQTPCSVPGRMYAAAQGQRAESVYEVPMQAREDRPVSPHASAGHNREPYASLQRTSYSASHRACARPGCRIPPGSQDGYRPSARCDDALPRRAEDSARVPSPPQGDVRGHTPTYSHTDDHSPSGECIPTYQPFAPHWAGTSPLAGRADGAEYPIPSSAVLSSRRSSTLPLRFHASSALNCTGVQSLRGLIESFDSSCSNSPYPLPNYTTVKSIKEEGHGSYYDLTVPFYHCYFDSQGILHHNSGKDFIAALFISYLAYVVLNLKDPCGTFGLDGDTPLAVLNVAPSEALARQVFFEYLGKFVKKDLFKPFLPNPRAQILADSIKFPESNLTLYSKHSRAAGLDGYNLLGWVMDEADEFMDTADRSNADIIHNILRSSANTRLRNRWIGMVISYPRVSEGFMERLYERAAGDSTFYRDLASTWEVRPDISRDDPGIASDYKNDPLDARAKYECIPMSQVDAFFETPERIDAAVDPTREPVALWRPIIVKRPLHDGRVNEFISAELESITKVPGRAYFLAGDGGLSGDLFALSVFHTSTGGDAVDWLCPMCGNDAGMRSAAQYERCEPGETIERPTNAGTFYCGTCTTMATALRFNNATTLYSVAGWWRRVPDAEEGQGLMIGGRRVAVPHVYEDLIVTFTPERPTRPGEGTRLVDFVGVQEVCRQIITGLGITTVRFDPWSTPQMQQGLQEQTGADVDKISFSQPDQYTRARLVKAMLYSGLITLLPHERRDREWKRLQRKGTKIDHPPKAGDSKDIYDSESVAIWTAVTDQCSALELEWA